MPTKENNKQNIAIAVITERLDLFKKFFEQKLGVLTKEIEDIRINDLHDIQRRITRIEVRLAYYVGAGAVLVLAGQKILDKYF